MKIDFSQPLLGMDVEFFCKSSSGQVIGAEKVIDDKRGFDMGYGKCIVDGVQAELNPQASHCRALIGNYIKPALMRLRDHLKSKGVSADFSGTIVVPEEEFKSLSEKSKIFGCDPDFNAHTGEQNKITVNPKKIRTRTAGGHIHLGAEHGEAIKYKTKPGRVWCNSCDCYHNIGGGENTINVTFGKNDTNIHEFVKEVETNPNEYVRKKLNKDLAQDIKIDISAKVLALTKEHKKVITMLDIIVGNTCVLLDRDPNAAKRRKVYGKAGDYRLPPHGLEYRTLSNFWMKSYQLMSLVLGLARLALLIVIHDIKHKTKYADEFIKAVNLEDIKNAINNNDFELAKSNFLKIEKLLIDLKGVPDANYPFNIGSNGIRGFKQFVVDGYEKYFSEDTFSNWEKFREDGHHNGWESFASRMDIKSNVDQLFLECKKA